MIDTTTNDTAVRKQLLQDKLSAIDNAQTEENKDRATAFLVAFGDAMNQYSSFEKAKFEIIRAQYEERDKVRAAKKLKSARSVYAEMEMLLEGFEHKNIALACKWHKSTGICSFDNAISRDILGPLLRAPSSASKKKTEAKVECIQTAYEIFYANGVFGENFPPKIPDNSPEAHKAIVLYGLQNMSQAEMLHDMADNNFLSSLQDSNLASAIFRETEWWDLDRRNIFEVYVSRDNDEMWKNMARKLWKNDTLPYHCENVEEFQTKFDKVKRRYEDARRSFLEYLQYEATVSFLNESAPPPHRPNQAFSRLDAIHVLIMKRPTPVLECLLRHEFCELLRRHRGVFNSPNKYGHDPNVRPTLGGA